METPRTAPGFVNPRPRKRPEAVVELTNKTPADPTGEQEQEPEQLRSAATNFSAGRLSKTAQSARVKEKREIKGDHPIGFGRPPKEHQFKPGNKGGPGRPRGSKSQNSLLRAEFDRKHTAREGGRTTKTSARQLISRLVVTGPITSRDHKDLAKLNALARDLYPDPASDTGVAEAYDPALDEFVLKQLFASLQLGEANAVGVGPMADRANGRLDLGHSVGADAWGEGDWDGAPGEVSDGDR